MIYILAAFLLVSILVSACDDETLSKGIIRVENQSGTNGVSVYVDDVFKGHVDSGNSLAVTDISTDGRRKFYAKGIKYTWNTYFEVRALDICTITLYSGWLNCSDVCRCWVR